MLCDPTVYDGRQPVLYTDRIPSGEKFTIQHFSVDYDLEELQREFLLQTRSFDLDGLLDRFKTSFHYMASSSNSQAFIVALDDTHLFQLEVHQASAHPTLLADLNRHPGDFILQLSAGNFDKTTPDRYAQALHATARYCFTFPEVHCLLLDTHLLPAPIRHILHSAGFRPLSRPKSIYHTIRPR